MSERIPQRNEIPAEHKWSIEDLYATDAAWEQDQQSEGIPGEDRFL